MSRDGIIEGMARAIWVSSYADWVSSMSKAEREAVGAPVNLDGVEWYEETPEAPEAVAGAARELVSLYESENDCSIEEIESRARRAEGRAINDEELGRYLAEMAMNTGVTWFDAHKPFRLEKPLLEAYYDGEFFEWSGRCKTTMQNPAKQSSANGPLRNIFLKREKNGWHVDAHFAKQTLNYGPFKTKELGMRMREAIIESDLQRNPCSPCKHNPYDDELELYISNDGQLYEKYTRPILVKLADAKSGGTYSREKAVREFMALAEIGEKKYQKEITPRHFTAAEKRDYANSAAEYFENEWELGNFADYATEAQTTFNPAGLTAKGERMYEHIKAGYGSDPRAKEIAARTVAARAKNVRGLRNPPFVLPVPGQAIRSWDHGDGHLVKICEEGSDGLYTATIKLATGRSVVVPLTRTEYDLTPRKLLDRRTGFSRHEQFLGPPQPDRLPKGTPMEFEDTDPFAVAPRAPRGPMEFDNDLQEWVPSPRRHSIPRKRR